MKKFLTVLIGLCLFASVFSTMAIATSETSTPEIEFFKDYQYIVNDGVATLIDYTGNEPDIIVPAYVNGIPVVAIPERLFSNNEVMKNVVIQEGIELIDYYAFLDCTSLESIKLPDTLQTIEYYAFQGCSSLKSIHLPEKITDIPKEAFSFCESLSSITVDENNEVYSSQDGVLFNKAKTALILYPRDKRDKKYIVPEGVTEIAANAFEQCVYMNDLILPDSLLYVGAAAFSYCYTLRTVYISANVTNISSSTFLNCGELKCFTVDENNELYTAKDGVLFSKDMTSLIKFPVGRGDTEYTIPEGVEEIQTRAFIGSVDLEKVDLPDSIIKIGSNAFWLTKFYMDYYYSDEEALYLDQTLIDVNPYITTIEIKEDTRVIADEAFFDNNNIEEINIPASVISIGEYTFKNCNKLKKITLNQGLKNIGASAFRGCSLIEDIEIPKSVISVGECAFKDTAYYNNKDNWENGKYNGILYIDNVLIFVGTNSNTYSIKKGTRVVADGAIEFTPCVYFPKSIKYIGKKVLGQDNLFSKNIIGYKNTAAQKYAHKHNLHFTDITKLRIRFKKKQITIKKGKKVTIRLNVKNVTHVDFNINNKKIKEIYSEKDRIIIQGVKKGKAVITAKVGNKTAKCKVTVKYG